MNRSDRRSSACAFMGMVALAFFSVGCNETHEFPSTLYASPDFEPRQVELIIEALDHWMIATDGIVDVDIAIGDEFDGHVIMPVTPEHEVIRKRDDANDGPGLVQGHANVNNSWGSCDPSHILIVEERLETEIEFFGTVMHELGHHWCFKQHSDPAFPSVMSAYSGMRTNCITQYDVDRFCGRYDCTGHDVRSTCTDEDLLEWSRKREKRE